MNFNQIQVGGPNDCPAETSTISSNDYNSSPTYVCGWVCPKCGRVYSPSTTMCLYCGGNSNTVPITCNDKTFPNDLFINHVTDPLTEPRIHLNNELH